MQSKVIKLTKAWEWRFDVNYVSGDFHMQDPFPLFHIKCDTTVGAIGFEDVYCEKCYTRASKLVLDKIKFLGLYNEDD